MLEGGYEPPRAAIGGSAGCDPRAWRALAGVFGGDHVCGAFCAEEDRRGLAGRFAVDALERGMRLLYLANGSSEATVMACLAQAGVDVGARRDSGQIEVRRAPDVYLADGDFHPERQIERLAGEAERACTAGFGGLAVTAEMCWALDARTDPERLLAYERAIGRVFPGGTISALCQYDALALPDELRERIAHAHPLSVATGPAGSVATRGPGADA
jgi:hypothetical protein